MKFGNFLMGIFLLWGSYAFSQQISIDDSIGLQPLIENNLVQNSCVEITNITSSVNGSSSGFSSYAQFNRAGSNFPFQNGIMLSTGNATSGGNGVTTPTLSEGSTIWGTDPDLEAALGVSNTLNATSIEFDIVSISSQLQFNYLLASEEYFGINPCQLSDGFAFLIKETGSALPYQNIALVPGTSTPVNTNTIHDEIFGVCPAQNSQYFDGYNIGDTNYNGRTNVLTASTTITPYVQYHIKLVIADQTDGTFDSAVFIEGNSFRILDLGDDVSTCAPSVTLDADIQNPQATYAWFLDNNPLATTLSTISATQDGTYRVEVTVDLNGNACVETDEIVVILNTEEPIAPISDYFLCDDISEDGIEVFDLSSKNTEVINNIPFTNYSFSYHLSDADARNNVNSISGNFSNTVTPQQTIYVRIQDLDSGCYGFTTFNLIVNPVPNVTDPAPLEICDSDTVPDGYTVIDLTQKDNEITGGQSNLAVSYHYSAVDADNGANPIPIPYVNTNTPTEVVYIRVIDTQTGCVNTSSLTIDITTSPIVDRNTQYIDACDADHDGSADFDLTQVINDVLMGLDPTTVTITFHETLPDAQSGINPVADETNYQYQNALLEPGSTRLYIRIEDNNTGCASIVPLEPHTNLLLTGTDTGDFALCDTNDDENDTLEFNLNTVALFIANELPNIMVTFYVTEMDRDTDTNPIDTTVLFAATSPTTVYIKIDDVVSGCSDFSEITLLVNPVLLFNPANPLPYCDTDDDGFVSIDLASLDDTVTGGNPNFEVRYFSTDIDAQNNTNQLPPFYTNTSMLETIYARIENIDTGCSTINPFEIQINLAPAATSPSPIVICDNDQDGFSIINLDDKISETVTSTTGINIDFFTSFDDADNNVNPITNRTNYNANTQTVYIRVENDDSLSCYNIVTLDVTVNTLPVIPNITPFQICKDDGTFTADFLLVDKDVEILNGQTGKEVYYFEDASFTTPIDKNTIYQNTTTPQTVYVRVENITDTTCFATSSFTLQVSSDPIYNTFSPYLICDDITNDQIHVFDLNEKITEISQGSPDNLNVTFHLTRQNAEDNINPQPIQYTNISNPQTLYVRIESSASFCYVVEELGINIIASPDITQATPFEQCDTDYDGFVTFNLENADFEILDRLQNDLIVNYFENFTDINQNDGLDNSNEILDPINYISNTRTVYIKVANTLTRCFSVIPLDLVVVSPPPTNNINTIEICDNDTDTFDLTTVNAQIVNDPSLVTISYHNSQNDADNNQNPIGNTYNYTANNHTIFVRVNDPLINCPITVSFSLQINPNPIANTAPDLISCDDDFDGFFEFDLSVNTNTIIGSQNTSTHTVTYYNDITNAESESNALPNLHSAFDGEIIYARIENNNTGCFAISQFATRINPLPIVPIEDLVPLCINDLPLIISADTGNLNDTYLWSTGETSTEILLDDVGDIGDYWVTVTTPHVVGSDCQYTRNFTVIESEDATINFTTKVDFADPNSITVDVSGIGDYVFILDDGEPQTSNVFENVTFGLHIVTIRDLNGCKDVTTEVVVIDIPKFVTPNNDGTFDTWHIVGVQEIPGTVVYIYNRHGKLLKTLPHTSRGWDGTFNGHNMPSDDYWFVAKVIQNGEAFDIKGHFALKR
ncbi:T9SS type B sorting domain-containing protein [Jejuia spongiicola]|uniref:T9SS type B sorting domain-containing protein n=1 Tax=Jejuia spongiicola TaxID=2942207 RepID=A0ABT0QCN0_9FLAO|nr:choice-of-anchor L domain-containing protein [Jejuia spongiicola]MCL6294735.1 T9SS type B sorting domain-containing protein [Jejuia spongiicola]